MPLAIGLVCCVCVSEPTPLSRCQDSGHLTNGFPTSRREEPGFPKQKAFGLANFKVGDRVAYSAAASSQLLASFPRVAALLRLREWMGDERRGTHHSHDAKKRQRRARKP